MKPFRGLFLHVLRETSAFFSSKNFLKNFNLHQAINNDYAVKLKKVKLKFVCELDDDYIKTKIEDKEMSTSVILGLMTANLQIWMDWLSDYFLILDLVADVHVSWLSPCWKSDQ